MCTVNLFLRVSQLVLPLPAALLLCAGCVLPKPVIMEAVRTSLVDLLNDSSHCASQVVAHVHGRDGAGITAKHFDALHTRLCRSTWSFCDKKWLERVRYTAPPHQDDSNRTPVSVSYIRHQEEDVRCYRRLHPVQLHLKGSTSINEQVGVRVAKRVDEKAMPPAIGTRPLRVCVQGIRRFIRRSSSGPHSWEYTLKVEWSAHCLNDAYALVPTYKVAVALLNASTTFQASSAQWMTEHLLAKIADVCYTQEFTLDHPPALLATDAAKFTSSDWLEDDDDEEDGDGEHASADDAEYMEVI